MITMIFIKLTCLTLILTIVTAFPSSSSSLPDSSANLPPQDLIDDLKSIATKIINERENIDKLTRQWNQLSSNVNHRQNLVKSFEDAKLVNPTDSTFKGPLNRMAPESSQPGGNPLVALQSRINSFFESMSQLFKNMRQVIERIPVPEDAELNPLKALQSLENQFQAMLAGLRVTNGQQPQQGNATSGGDNQ